MEVYIVRFKLIFKIIILIIGGILFGITWIIIGIKEYNIFKVIAGICAVISTIAYLTNMIKREQT